MPLDSLVSRLFSKRYGETNVIFFYKGERMPVSLKDLLCALITRFPSDELFSFSTKETAATTGAVVGSKRVGLCKSTGIWMKKAAAKANSQPELEPGGILWPNFRAIQLVLAGRRSRTSFFFVKALGSSSRKASDFDHDDENEE